MALIESQAASGGNAETTKIITHAEMILMLNSPGLERGIPRHGDYLDGTITAGTVETSDRRVAARRGLLYHWGFQEYTGEIISHGGNGTAYRHTRNLNNVQPNR